METFERFLGLFSVQTSETQETFNARLKFHFIILMSMKKNKSDIREMMRLSLLWVATLVKTQLISRDKATFFRLF